MWKYNKQSLKYTFGITDIISYTIGKIYEITHPLPILEKFAKKLERKVRE